MNLIFRFFRFLFLSIFHLLLAIIFAIFRYLLVVLNAFFRVVLWPLLIAVLRVLRDFVFLSLTATVTGPGQYADRLASEWTRYVLEIGVPREMINLVYSLCRILVVSTIILGWIIATLFTVVILRVVFGFQI